jgi:hypothetical protein
MPGTIEPFFLNKYKEDLGKPYSKIYFWLCSSIDVDKVRECEEDVSDGSDPEPSGTCMSFLKEQTTDGGEKATPSKTALSACDKLAPTYLQPTTVSNVLYMK